MNGSTLPNFGIQDYEHVKAISREIKQNILKIENDQWDRSISLEDREPLGGRWTYTKNVSLKSFKPEIFKLFVAVEIYLAIRIFF